MHFRFAFAAVLAVLLLLTACERAPLSSSASPSPSSAQATVDSEVSLQLREEMLRMATLYEQYTSGADYQPSSDGSHPIDYAFGWLRETGIAEQYLDEFEQAYVIPFPDLDQTASLFFGAGSISGWDPDQVLYYSTDYITYQERLTISAKDCYAEADRLILKVERSFDGEPLLPAVYTFQQATAQTVPPFARQAIQPGDPVLQIVAVDNQEREAPIPEVREISSSEDLIALSQAINSGDRAAQEYRYLLTCDLDLSGVEFTPIGTNRTLMPFEDHRDPTRSGFHAVFDGQGHTIQNLTLSLTALPQEDEERPYDPTSAGLFARIGGQGHVMNLNLKNCSVSIRPGEGEDARPGPAGLLAGIIEGTVSDCAVQGTVNGGDEVGGFAGQLGGYDLGGARVIRCYADAAVSGQNSVGGFAGMLHGSRISDCAAAGSVTSVAGPDGTMPGALGGFGGHAVGLRMLDHSFASVAVNTSVPTGWVGGFLGGCEGVGGTVTGCAYDQVRAPGWEPIDYVSVHDDGAPPEVKALSPADCRAEIEKLFPLPAA